jgi:hypothetical protein
MRTRTKPHVDLHRLEIASGSNIQQNAFPQRSAQLRHAAVTPITVLDFKSHDLRFIRGKDAERPAFARKHVVAFRAARASKRYTDFPASCLRGLFSNILQASSVQLDL